MRRGCTIGVDVGGTKALTGVVADDGSIRYQALRMLPTPLDTARLLTLIVECVRDAERAASVVADAVGIGIPSLVDVATGTAISTVHLPLNDIPVRDLMSARLGLPVAVDNDATCAMVAEHRCGAARAAKTAALLTIGTGIGGALVADSKIVRGASGAAGEWGHMVIDVYGRSCGYGCRNYGCFESLVSGPALARMATQLVDEQPNTALACACRSGQTLNGELVTTLAVDGDDQAVELLAAMGEMLGIGLVNIANILNPEVIVLGGGVMAAGDLLLAPAQRVLRERALRPAGEQARVVATRFGAAAGMVGAALLAFDRLGRDL